MSNFDLECSLRFRGQGLFNFEHGKNDWVKKHVHNFVSRVTLGERAARARGREGAFGLNGETSGS